MRKGARIAIMWNVTSLVGLALVARFGFFVMTDYAFIGAA